MFKESPLELLVHKLETHTRLGEDDRRALLTLPYRLKTLEAERFILSEGEVPRFSAVLIYGFAFRQKVASDGSRQIVSLHMPGDPVDFQSLFLDISDHDIRTLTDVMIATVPRAEIQRLVRTYPAISEAIIAHLLIEASISREWILNVGRRDATTALAHVLCEWAVRFAAQGLASDDGYELPMSMDQLADVLGLTPVHVSRTMKTLVTKGLIMRDKRHISFADWTKVCEVGDFNGLYLHLQAGHADLREPRPRTLSACR
jgi:CRP-like cAMP-binding protein